MPNQKYPKHLYHENMGTVVVDNADQEADYKGAGYGETYIPQEFPKSITIHVDENGKPTQAIANNAEEEAALRAHPGFKVPEAPAEVETLESESHRELERKLQEFEADVLAERDRKIEALEAELKQVREASLNLKNAEVPEAPIES